MKRYFRRMRLPQVAVISSVFFAGVIASSSVFAADKPIAAWSLDAKQRSGNAKVKVNTQSLMTIEPGETVSLPLRDKVIRAVVVKIEQKHGSRIIHLQQADAFGQPHAVLFQHADGFSAWLPTEKGTFRIRDGRLFKELRRGKAETDIRIPNVKQGLQGDRTNAFHHDHHSSHDHHNYHHQDLHQTNNAYGVKHDHGEHSLAANGPTKAAFTLTESGKTPINVMFVVTNRFVQQYSDVQARLTEYVTANNNIYTASGVNAEIVNAGYVEVALDNVSEAYILDVISNNNGAATGNLSNGVTSDMLQTIWNKRVETKADFVVVMKYFNTDDGICGLGFLNGDNNKRFSYDLSVNATIDTYQENGQAQQSCGMSTLGHEIGHNMGLGHSLKQGDIGSVFDYGRGYGVDGRFTTIMAYPSEFDFASEVSLFSSPELTCETGLACGIDHTQFDGADAVRAINQALPQMANIYDGDSSYFTVTAALNNLSDANLRACIQQSVGYETVAPQLTILRCSGAASLNGLEHFYNINNLDLSGSSQVTDISALANMQQLQYVDLQNTQVSDLAPLAGIRSSLSLLYIGVDNLTCQQVNVAENAWGIGDFFKTGSCRSLSSDSEDFDNDGTNNLIDTDDDNDGIDDISDARPFDNSNANDIDGDGTLDSSDAFPYDASEQLDTDLDGKGNNSDTDDDNDGMSDTFENTYGFNPLSPSDASQDADNDGLSNLREAQLGTLPNNPDTDNDGVSDGDEVQAGTDPTVPATGTSSALRHDINGDGYGDILFRDDTTRQWSMHFLTNTNAAVTDNVSGMSSVASWQFNGVGDFNGDNYDDVIIRNAVSGQWYIYNFQGASMVSRGYVGLESAALVSVQAVADFNQDGKSDVLLRNVQTGAWTLSLIDDKSVTRTLQPPMSQVVTWGIVDAADFDGNGSPDILIRNSQSGTWYVYLYNGTDISSRGYLTTLTSDKQEEVQGVADFDGDGANDVLLRHSGTGAWSIAFMNGLTPKSTESLALPTGASWQFVAADDYTRDGRADVVLRGGNRVRLYSLNGTTISSQADIDTTLATSQKVQKLN